MCIHLIAIAEYISSILSKSSVVASEIVAAARLHAIFVLLLFLSTSTRCVSRVLDLLAQYFSSVYNQRAKGNRSIVNICTGDKRLTRKMLDIKTIFLLILYFFALLYEEYFFTITFRFLHKCCVKVH